jgi:ribonuclease BN (tRNA processing enzyme)
VRLTVVGSAGTFPGPESGCSSYLLEHEGYKLLLDMGNGSMGELQKYIDLREIDAVFVSHLHGDHCLDLVTYTYARRYHPGGGSGPLAVFGPAKLEARLCNSFDRPIPGGIDDVFAFHVVSDSEKIELGPFHLVPRLVSHPVECYGVRVEAGGRTLAYSADSGPIDSLIDLARDADVFLAEASYLEGDENPPGVHMTGKEAAEHATRASAQSLLLTHLVPWNPVDRVLADAESAYSGPIALATRGLQLDI